MPRGARVQSRSGVYHVILRGIDRQEIFYDEEDHAVFIDILKFYKTQCHFKVYAYCLMNNHVHLLIKPEGEELSIVMKKIGITYACQFNKKYERCGHVFQDRFRSEPVEDQRYFITVLRYILQNPVKGGLCSAPENYIYSSMRAYCGKTDDLTDIRLAVKMYGQQGLLHFLRADNKDTCLEMNPQPRKGMTDTKAEALIKQIIGASPNLDKSVRPDLKEKIRHLHDEGVTIHQISRLSGIPRGIVQRSLK